ncbi:hypothetical protein [Glycomyces tenuis]|uniref:hypothetical protein n=1 Tax=Glycomyces tenuis TaxID=58116 RepID=UPI0003F965AB|nr:hypothetical protein [Glycomyces tenuis]
MNAVPDRPRPNRREHEGPQTERRRSEQPRPGASQADTPGHEHRLGSFRFAKSLELIVIGDAAADPTSVRVMLDDGFQAPYRILTIDGLDRFRPPPEPTWLEGWITKGDPWARIIYGSTIGVVRQSRSNGESTGGSNGGHGGSGGGLNGRPVGESDPKP